jgi:hypothetical protein
MADRHVQIKQRNGAGWDNIFPRNKAVNVLMDDGSTLSSKFSELVSAIGSKASSSDITTAITNIVGGADGAFDTLKELEAALGNDSNFASNVTNAIALKAPLASPTFTGVPTVPTAAVDTANTQIASTGFVINQLSTIAPYMNGTAAVGSSKKMARADHVHQSDTSRAPINSPAFTGSPTVPNQPAGDNSTKIASTSFVAIAVNNANLSIPIISTTEPTTGNFWYQEIV